MSLLDRQRNALEEYDTLDFQVSERIRRNPNLTDGSSKKRPRKEEIMQQHEMCLMAERMTKQAETFNESEPSKTKLEIESMKDLEFTFADLHSKIKDTMSECLGIQFVEDINGSYAMYLSATNYSERGGKVKVQRKEILSKTCAPYLDIEFLFSPTELWGTILDLYPFYRQKHCENDERLYVSYLESLVTSKQLDMHQASAILSYLVDFWKRSHPLMNVDKKLIEVRGEVNPSSSDGQIWCGPCNKWFKESVYYNHLDGKKHKRAAKHTTVTKNPNRTDGEVITWILENPLKKEFEGTKRAAAQPQTDRERLLEVSRLEGEDSDYTDVDSGNDDNDSDDDTNLLANLPTDANGRPIPHWLYKLQGLNKSFHCEICGNAAYQGKITFERHFTQSKHQYGLKCLGVREEQVIFFNSITSIKEAQNLLLNLQQKQKDKYFEEEVEDSEGNVMSKSDYDELKQQGLL